MLELARKEILEILTQTTVILRNTQNRDVIQLKNLSESAAKNASLSQDTNSISVAIITYALSKIIEREDSKF